MPDCLADESNPLVQLPSPGQPTSSISGIQIHSGTADKRMIPRTSTHSLLGVGPTSSISASRKDDYFDSEGCRLSSRQSEYNCPFPVPASVSSNPRPVGRSFIATLPFSHRIFLTLLY